MNSEKEKKDIEKARNIELQISSLYEQIDVLLAPICRKAHKLNNIELIDLIQSMPDGFYRTELRVILNQNKNKQF